jgi:hypothetical protein
MFVITDHPKDFPDYYVARLWLSLPTVRAGDLVILDRKLESLRTTMAACGMVRIDADPTDDPVILEIWI